MTKTPLTVGTIINHYHFGRGKIVCSYEDSNVGDMVDVHWLEKNEILDHREENLRFGLTAILPPAITPSVWLTLLDEEK